MKFYLVFVKRITDGTEARELLAFTDLNQAKASMHTKLGSAMSDPNCAGAFAVVLNNYGFVCVNADSYIKEEEVDFGEQTVVLDGQ